MASCSAHLSTCTFDGVNCIAKVAACTIYDAQAAGSGAAANCANMIDTTGNKCTFASGSKCSARACNDTISNPSSANCVAYLSACIFNGSACISS